MKRVYFVLLGLLVMLSGCISIDSAAIQTHVRRDGSVARRLEFMIDGPIDEFREVCALPQVPQWHVKISKACYIASREFPASGQKHTDFVLRPFKPNSPLGRFEGRNEWQVIRRRGLFSTTYTYQEVLRFPGLREAYVKTLTDTVYSHMTRALRTTEAEQKQLFPEVQRAVERASGGWEQAEENKDIATLMTDSLSRSLNRLRPRGWEARQRSEKWLSDEVSKAYDKFRKTNCKSGTDDDRLILFYSFRTTLPGQIIRASGQLVGANQVHCFVFGSEFLFHPYMLFAESQVRQINWLALFSLLVLAGLPVAGVVSFFRRYRLIVRVARRTIW